MSDYHICPFCGKGAYVRGFPPHGDDPCPLKVEEHQTRLASIERCEGAVIAQVSADLQRREKHKPRTR